MAYQTSCASYTSGRVGLSSATAVVADAAGREQTQHGSPLFPIACYAEDLSCYSVAWHWHEAVPWQRQVLLCLREAWKGVADEPFDYENRVRYHLTAALRLLITQCVSGKVKVSEQEQIASERMKQMLRYVEEHYAEELTVEKLAGCVALSESACLRSFRQFLGITPIQYVKQFRVEKAAELLRSTRLKTGEVGLECGFSDASYFIKTFREIKHCTPREYRIRFC